MDIQLSSDLSRRSLSNDDIVNAARMLDMFGFDLGVITSDEDVNEERWIVLENERGENDSDAPIVLLVEGGNWVAYYAGARALVGHFMTADGRPSVAWELC